jgi:hypothetical protein
MAKINFFEENEGEQSMTRLALFLTLVNAICIADALVIMGALSKTPDYVALAGAGVALFTGLVAPMATIKLLQKSKE